VPVITVDATEIDAGNDDDDDVADGTGLIVSDNFESTLGIASIVMADLFDLLFRPIDVFAAAVDFRFETIVGGDTSPPTSSSASCAIISGFRPSSSSSSSSSLSNTIRFRFFVLSIVSVLTLLFSKSVDFFDDELATFDLSRDY
jgi:hypothetical protein